MYCKPHLTCTVRCILLGEAMYDVTSTADLEGLYGGIIEWHT